MLLNNPFKLYAALRLGTLASILNVGEVSARVVGSSDIRENIKESKSFAKNKGDECIKLEADISGNKKDIENVDVGVLGCGEALICLEDESSSTGSRCVDSEELQMRDVGKGVLGSTSVPAAQPGQIDAIGNILENLGVPQTNGTLPSGDHSTNTAFAASTTAATGGGGLTLADLQGAMAGLGTASPSTTDCPPLSELATAEIIDESGILNDLNATACLIALLPENQRNDALRDNLRSPQVSQCLQRLTAALSDDAASFNSIIANFQLDPRDGTEALDYLIIQYTKAPNTLKRQSTEFCRNTQLNCLFNWRVKQYAIPNSDAIERKVVQYIININFNTTPKIGNEETIQKKSTSNKATSTM
eukprot:scaffold46666_cov54-Cyclotella_meneghiniana.AAC.1